MKEKPLYIISIVSDLIGIHPQTLRQYERLGLVEPSRTIGNTRLYSEENIERLKYITLLTRNSGVNLAGVEIILKMQKEIDKLNNHISTMTKYINQAYGEDIKQKTSIDQTYTKITITRG